jgi:uncharacterized membrane protein YozB (DUF420 family)
MAMELTPDAPRTWQAPRAKAILFLLIGAMYLYVLLTTESFLVNKSDPEWTHIEPFKTILLPHGLVAALALLLAPFQFSERLRRKYITVHKTMGYLYITGCFLGAPLGIYIQWFQERFGGIETRSFTVAAAVDAAIWIFATTMALYFIRQRKIQQHRLWMTRSFACALIFLEVRVIGVLFQVPISQIETVVWCCVAAAFPIADLTLQIEEQLRSRARTARA